MGSQPRRTRQRRSLARKIERTGRLGRWKSPGRSKEQEGLCRRHQQDPKDRKGCEEVTGKIQRTGRTVQRSPGRFKGQERLCRRHREDPKDRKDCAEDDTRKIQRTGRTVQKMLPEDSKDGNDCAEKVTRKIQRTERTVKRRSPGRSKERE